MLHSQNFVVTSRLNLTLTTTRETHGDKNRILLEPWSLTWLLTQKCKKNYQDVEWSRLNKY